jgi:hypothetical protein
LITLANQEFDVEKCSKQDLGRYEKYILGLAKIGDSPLERFCAKLKGLSATDRASAIHGFMLRPDWDRPSDEQISQAEVTREGVSGLCWLHLRPRLTQSEFFAMLVSVDPKRIRDQIFDHLLPPTDEQIIAANKPLMDKLRAAQKAGNDGT